jgi:formate hydrogenlyase transcriptional activator
MKIAEHGPDLASLQALVDFVPAFIHTARRDGSIDFFNQRWLEFMGVRLDDVEGWKWTAAIHPDDVDALVAKWRVCLASGEPFEFESRVRRADGAYRWMLHQRVPLRNASGEIVKWYGSSVDIDDRKQAEFSLLNQELRRREAYLAEAQRLSHTGTFGWRPDSGEIVWSAETYRIFEYDEGIKPTLDAVVRRVHPEDRVEFQRVTDTASDPEASYFEHTYRLLLPGGRVKHVHALARRIADAFESREFVGAVTDVTERTLAEEALRESEERFRLVVDSIAGLVSTLTPGGDVDFVNRQVLEYFGKTFDELKQWQTINAVHPDDLDRVVALWNGTVATGQPYDVEHRLRRFDGTYRWFHARGRPLRDAAGAVTRWYVLLTDIDERKQAEQRLKEQEAELWQMLDFAPQLIAVFGPTFNRLYINRMAQSYLGVTLDEWLHREIPSDVHPEDAPRLQANVEQAIQDQRPTAVEVRARGGDGTYRWFLARHNPVRDDKGRVVRWFAGLTDIDDRKRVEERLEQENVALREEIDKTSMFEEIVGASSALKALLSRVSKVAGSDSTVLITGETGTGKELVARAIHKRSRRVSRAFVAVNCAAIPRDLIASELFGHEKGAFTGAVQRQLGRFELADGGTIFLDEVGELSSDMQVSLLRVLQEREFDRIGGRQRIHVDVRVIAATNRDLTAAVAGGTFRQDLFYRLNVFPLEMPPLRERRDDIPVLVEYFIDRYARKAGKTIRRVNKRTLDRLQSYPWPGNVRELQNVIERSVIICDTDEFTVDESWLSTGPARESPHALSSTIAGHEKTIIEDALRASGGRVFGPSGAAARLGIARSTLESKIRTLGINKNRFRARTAKP